MILNLVNSSWSFVRGLWSRGGLTNPERGAQLSGVVSASSSPESAMSHATFWRCTRILTETVGTLPMEVFQKETKGRKALPASHALVQLLSNPNEYMTRTELLESWMLGLVLHGNAYSRIGRNTQGTIVALHPLQADLVQPTIDDDGRLWYLYQSDNRVNKFAASDILHIKGFGLGLVGLSLLSYAAQAIGLAQVAEKTADKVFKKGGKPSGIMMVDKILTKEQRDKIRENFYSIETGGDGGLHVLEAHMKYQQLSMSPADQQLLDNRKFQAAEVARFFGVPPILLGDSEKSTSWGSGIEQQNQAFLTYTLEPYLNRIEQALKKRLLTPEQRAAGIYFEFNLTSFLRADSAGRAAYYSSMTQNGIMTRNECREKENLPPKAGGDDLTVQINLAPVEKLGLFHGGQAQ